MALLRRYSLVLAVVAGLRKGRRDRIGSFFNHRLRLPDCRIVRRCFAKSARCRVSFAHYFLRLQNLVLSNPQKISPIIADAYFITTAIEEMDIENIDHLLKNSRFELLKIVPRITCCQQQLKKMYRTCPEIASRIFLMADSGKLSYPFWSRFTR